MSGALKSGLLFALVGVVGLIAFTVVPSMFVPLLGVCICGPLAIVLNGIASGYFGVQWSTNNAGIGSGVLAGTISGVGILLATLLLFVGLLFFTNMVAQSDPEAYRAALEEAMRQQGDTQLTVEQLEQMVGIILIGMGFCFGILGLLISLAFGAVGAWIAVSRRPKTPIPPTMPTPPTSFEPPSFGPPPLSPS